MQNPNGNPNNGKNRQLRNPLGGPGDKKDPSGSNAKRPRVPTWLIGLLVVSVAVW